MNKLDVKLEVIMKGKYKKVAVGGTFDFLHIGHKALISKAFEVGEFVTIGITTDQFTQSYDKAPFESQEIRKKNLETFLSKNNFLERSKIIWLNDIFGVALESSFEALVVTLETKKAAELINQERLKKGLKVLQIIVQPFLKDQSGEIISSTRIREGKINPGGLDYKKYLLQLAGRDLTDSVKDKLKAPLGEVVEVKEIEKENVIYVGDITTLELSKIKKPKLAIFDNLVARQPFESNIRSTIKVSSPAGQISKELILKIEQSLRGQDAQVIEVKGEEDLAAIPAALLASLGTALYYGQPNKGTILINIDLNFKDKLVRILSV